MLLPLFSTGTATSGTDYVALPNDGTSLVTFGNGVTTAAAAITVLNDVDIEDDELFFALLSNPSDGIIEDVQAASLSIIITETGRPIFPYHGWYIIFYVCIYVCVCACVITLFVYMISAFY